MSGPIINITNITNIIRSLRQARRILLVACLGGVLSGPASGALPASVGGQELPSLAPMLESVLPAVVNIGVKSRSATQGNNPLLEDPFYRRFFGLPEGGGQRETQGAGSGVIVDEDNGYVITNHHVIEDASEIIVTLADGRELPAKLIGSDRDSDVAVIQVPSDNIRAIALGNSDELRVGDFVVAIGNPFGIGQTVTSGIVSALQRRGLGLSYENFIQTDAAINMGNSGGALVTLDGRLVGINTAILSRGGGNVGIGFAIPVAMVQRIVDQLVEYGEVRRGKLGVYIQDLTSDLAEALGVPDARGALISNVILRSPADKAGLQQGDVVVEVNGREIRGASGLRNSIGLLRVGSEVAVVVLREGERLGFNIVIEDTDTVAARDNSASEGERLSQRFRGAGFRTIAPSESGLERSAVIVAEIEPGSPAAESGLQKGDIITSVNRIPVTDVDELRNAVSAGSSTLLLNLRRGDGALFLVIR